MISVIIPIYNSEKFLNQCIQSVVVQDEVEEIILINDGSTDSSGDIIQQWRYKDDRIILLEHLENQNMGSGISRNLGLDLASKEFVNFLDADDYLLEKRFRDTILFLSSNKGADGYYESIKVKREPSHPNKQFSNEYKISDNIGPDRAFEAIVNNDFGRVQISGFTFRTEFLLNNNIKCSSHKRGQDLGIIFGALSRGRIFLSCSEYKVVRRLHGSNAILDDEQERTDLATIYKQWWEEISRQNHSKRVYRKFFLCFLHYRPFISSIKCSILRKLVKIFFCLAYGLYRPKRLLKLL